MNLALYFSGVIVIPGICFPVSFPEFSFCTIRYFLRISTKYRNMHVLANASPRHRLFPERKLRLFSTDCFVPNSTSFVPNPNVNTLSWDTKFPFLSKNLSGLKFSGSFQYSLSWWTQCKLIKTVVFYDFRKIMGNYILLTEWWLRNIGSITISIRSIFSVIIYSKYRL